MCYKNLKSCWNSNMLFILWLKPPNFIKYLCFCGSPYAGSCLTIQYIFFIFSVTNLKYWGRCEPVISRTLQFLNDLSVGYPFHYICDVLTQHVHLHGQAFFHNSNFPEIYNKKSNLFSLIYKCVYNNCTMKHFSIISDLIWTYIYS